MEVIFALFTFILSIGGVLCAFIVPIAVFVGLGIFLYRRSKMRDAVKQSAQSWPGTMGVVTMSTIQVRHTGRSRSEIPVVGYQYQVHGQTYTGGTIKAGEKYFSVRLYGEAQKTIERYPVGAQVMVYYNPANPSESALER
ncbi:MAG TPA: DUF3592 domain-containing protein [Anaerolineales bacterium]|nr:DUF3592 domain-containing protein [Anaerolineales bacterium]